MVEMKLSNEKPAIYDRCAKEFGVSWDNGIIITYGDTVHCKYPLSKDLMVHEYTHVVQQSRVDRDIWWDSYMTNRAFRLEQEVEAYNNQLDFINRNCNREQRRIMRKSIIRDMVTFYGGMCTSKEADALLIR
jgi:hypothetical protein